MFTPKLLAAALIAIGSISCNASPAPAAAKAKGNSSYTNYPDIADVSHTTKATADFFRGYFNAKNGNNASAWWDYFNPNKTSYSDSTLGFSFNTTQWRANVLGMPALFSQKAPNDRSYPLRILGDLTHGAVVYLVDTAGLFGAEIRSISSVDFVNGKISRQLDNWDGRDNAALSSPVNDSAYPYELALPGSQQVAAPEIKAVVQKLNTTFAAGDAAGAAALFDYNAIFEDLTLRLRVEGQFAIGYYLNRSIAKLPYGPGTNVTHVLGNARGGGYEWRPANGTTPVRYGITALELNAAHNITRFTAVWDGSRLNASAIQALAALAPSP